MAALTTNVPIMQVGDYVSQIQVGVDGAASEIFESAMVCALTATGYAAKAGTASCGPVLGVAQANVDNSAGSDGDLSIDLLQGLFWRPNAGTVTQAHYGAVVYAANDQDITATKSTNPIAGICVSVDSTQGVLVLINATINRALQSLSDIASVANGFGASLVGVEDAAANFTGTDVEAVLAEIMTQMAGVTGTTGGNLIGYDDSGSKTSSATMADVADEIYVDLLSAKCTFDVPMTGAWYEIDGTALAAFADGASNTPGLALDNSEAAGLRWNNAANPDPICTVIPVPYDLDESVDVTLSVVASKSGATVGDATTFDVGVFNNVTGALADADADYGGTSAAMTGDATAKTVQSVDLILALADLPDPDSAHTCMTVTIQPTDGTLGTDDVTIHFLRFTYTRKLRTS